MRRVDPNIYTKEYYLTDCTGHEEFKESFGESLEPRFREILPHVSMSKGLSVLDIGCGRGELVYYSASKGANAFGIDYSIDAISLAKDLKSKKNPQVKKRMNFFVMDAKKLKFDDSYFDLIFITDVVEHLYDEELKVVFNEVTRVLKPNGKIILHTAPNKLFNDYAYRYYSYPISTLLTKFWNLVFRKKYPNIAKFENLRTDLDSKMHINEPTYFSLSKLFKKYRLAGSIRSTNITVRKQTLSYKDYIFNLLVFLDPISRFFPVNVFFGSDFFVILKREK